MIDIRQTENYANYLSLEGWKVERIDEINYFIKKLPVIGAVLKLQRPKKIDFKVIDKLCRKYGVFQIILEPSLLTPNVHKLIIHHGFKQSKLTYLPSKTLQIDLIQNQKEILSHFKKDCRRAVKRSKILDRGGEVITAKEYSSPKEIEMFREAWKNSVNLKRYVPSLESLLNLRKSFSQNKSLFLASHNISGRIIGGALFTVSSHGLSNYITYYWHAFTSSEGRTSLSQYPLLYQGILWAKQISCKAFDFEGVYDSRFPDKSWLGFSHFKHSFGGTEVVYPGCYTKFRFPI